MKKYFPTFIDKSAEELDSFCVSAGKMCIRDRLKDSGDAADGSDLPEKLEKKIKEVLA